MEDKSIFKNETVRALLAGAVGLVLISWYRVFKAGTLMVDAHGLSGSAGNFVFGFTLLSLGLFSLAYYRLWRNNTLQAGQVKVLAFVLAYIFSCMLPMLSNDTFSYLVFGDAINKGADVYTNPQCTHLSSFYPYITGIWTHSTCAYGPVVLLLAMLAAWCAAGKIWMALIIYKMAVLVFALVFIELAGRVAETLQAPLHNLVFIVLNPIFLLQGVGQLHPDLIAITLVLLGIYLLLTNNWQLALIFAALGIATKMNYVLMLPFFFAWPALQPGFPKDVLWRRAGAGFFIAPVILGTAYFPFYTSLATITVPFNFHFFQNPSKCIGELLSYPIYFAPKLLSAHGNDLASAVSAGGGPVQQVAISSVIVKICQGFALSGSLYLLYQFITGQRSVMQWFRVYVRTLLLFILYYLHIFNPWYLMMFLPFMWAEEEPAFMHWLFVLTCFISVQDLVCTISRTGVVYGIELGLTFLSVPLFLYKPRRMFFTSLKLKENTV